MVLPVYIISQKISIISFGQVEYLIQGLLLIIFCLVMKELKSYLISFIGILMILDM